jgi:hypothetical protein
MQVTLIKGKAQRVPLQLQLRADGEDAQLLIDRMKPMLRTAMGKMGDNFHFFVTANQDNAGRRLISPYEACKVRVSLEAIDQNEGGAWEFAFPLDSLHVARKCANCGQPAHISWSYCPFCGQKHAN